MTNVDTARATPPGLATSFTKKNPDPTAEEIEAADQIAARHGFVSLGAGGAPNANDAATDKATTEAASKYSDRVNIRVSTKDRIRFEDFAHDRRMSKGEAFALAMDYAERMAELLKERGGA